MGSLESVQALLVAASYSAERSLILSFASRMALDRHMDEAFDRLMQYVPMKRAEEGHAILGTRTEDEDERSSMREARTWFGLLVLEHMYAHCLYPYFVPYPVDPLDSVSMEESPQGID